MRKKVIILTPFYGQIGGAETFADELFNAVSKHHIVWLCTIDWRGVWRGINWKDSFIVVWRLLWKAKNYFNHGRPDTVHALGFTATFVAAILKPIYKYKLICTPLALYDFDNKFLKWIVRWTLKRVDVVFAESYKSKKNLSQVTKRKKIKVFTHWVDTKKFKPGHYRRRKRLKVLFVGRAIWDKGAHIIQEVEEKLKRVKFVYVTNIPNNAMPKYYQMADILVVPSLYAESPNRVVAEGAACGCVVIVSRRGALPEQVKGLGVVVNPTVIGFKGIINYYDKRRGMLKLMRARTIKYARLNLTERNAQKIVREY